MGCSDSKPAQRPAHSAGPARKKSLPAPTVAAPKEQDNVGPVEHVPVNFGRKDEKVGGSSKFSRAYPASVAALSVGTSAGGVLGCGSSRGSRHGSRWSMPRTEGGVTDGVGDGAEENDDVYCEAPIPKAHVVLVGMQAEPLVLIKGAKPPPQQPLAPSSEGSRSGGRRLELQERAAAILSLPKSVTPKHRPPIEYAAVDVDDDDAPPPPFAHKMHIDTRDRDDASRSDSPTLALRTPKARRKRGRKNEVHDIGDYTVFKFLGQGSWATVHQCRHKNTGEEYAIKSWDKRKMGEEELAKSGKREAAILKRLSKEQHPNVSNYVETLESSKWYHLVVDLGVHGDFSKMIKKNPLGEAAAAAYFRQLLSVTKFIHSNNIVHRDIKPENLLLATNDTLLLTDFGLGDFIRGGKTREDRLMTERCGTPDFVAPEILRSNSYDGPLADAWSCGVTLYCFLVGRTPWTSARTEARYKEIARGTWKNDGNREQLAALSDQAFSCLGKLLRADPQTRYGVSTMLKHPWLKPHEAPRVAF